MKTVRRSFLWLLVAVLLIGIVYRVAHVTGRAPREASGAHTGREVASEVPLSGPRDINGTQIRKPFDRGREDQGRRQAVTDNPVGIIRTELAGYTLSDFPFFEYALAFNRNAAVEAAVDPGLFPELVGTQADLYIVSTRTEAEWCLDASLTDVRADGPQTVVFGGTTIQENTFLVAGPDELDANAGTGFGVGYDVVLDTGRDGVLNAGDFIDNHCIEAGFYVVHDTTLPGPLAVSEITYHRRLLLTQTTWYPSNIASMGRLPLIVISHGNGHNAFCYEYLQKHLASYGYVVMSHFNSTVPGVEAASTSTLTATDYFLGHLASIGGGIFDGHIDGDRITWIGHSRGGEGVCRAYDRLYDGVFMPEHYTLEDIVLISSIAPNDYLGHADSNPHGATFHLLVGSADGDNDGAPDHHTQSPYHVYERAHGNRQATYVHGADHNDFSGCGPNDFDGPSSTAIGRAESQRVAKAVYLALVKHYGSPPKKLLT